MQVPLELVVRGPSERCIGSPKQSPKRQAKLQILETGIPGLRSSRPLVDEIPSLRIERPAGAARILAIRGESESALVVTVQVQLGVSGPHLPAAGGFNPDQPSTILKLTGIVASHASFSLSRTGPPPSSAYPFQSELKEG